MSDPDRPDRVARRVVAHGHVQGVFFRDSLRRLAASRDVSGWVANRPDGALEAVFEGASDDVEALVEFCRSGPRGAQVERLEVDERDPEGLGGFEVR